MPRLSKYNINHNFFSTLTEHSAYALGYIVGDGCISEECNKGIHYDRLIVVSAEKQPIEALSQIMESTYPIYERHNKQFTNYRLQLQLSQMCKDLRALGLQPNKSEKGLTHYPDIPKHLQCHFLRGLMDSDGCVTGDTWQRRSVSWMSTEVELIHRVNESLPFNFLHPIETDKRGKLIYCVRVRTRERLLTLKDFLYPTPDVPCNHRKRDKLFSFFT